MNEADGGNGGCRRKGGGSVPPSIGPLKFDEIQKEENNNIISTSWRKEEHIQSIPGPP